MKNIRKQTIKTKTFILLLLISFTILVCAGAVSAADNDTIYVANNGSDVNNGFSWDTPKLSIKNATGTVNTNGTIHIANGTYTGPNNRGITIGKNMTIIGQSQTGTIIDAEKQDRIFTINNGISVTLQNLTLQNGTAGNGGAIYNWYGTCTVNDSIFIGNTANGLYGGAIYNWYGTCTVNDSIFIGNTANYQGGAIYNYGTLTVSGSTFRGNTATSDGGAINTDHGTLTVNGSTFTNNHGWSGGAICSWDTASTIYSSRIFGNTASQGNAISKGFGGSVNAGNNWWGSNNPDFGSLIVGNVYVTPWLTSDPGPHLMFVNNQTGDDTNDGSDPYHPKKTIGNAVANVAINGIIHIADGTYTGPNNRGITINKNMIIIGQSQIGTIIDGSDARIAYISPSVNVTLHDLTITNGNAEGVFGVIQNEGNLTIENCNFTNNYATWGGAIYNGDTLTVSNSNFDHNSAGIGGAICNNGGISTVSDSIFTNNQAEGYGGVIYNNYGDLNVENCNFIANMAGNGAIFNNYANCIVTSSNFINNHATLSGGALNNERGNLTVISSNFIGNSADLQGGAIADDHGNLTAHFNRIVGNSAFGSVGYSSIESDNGTVNVENNWWSSNNPNWNNIISGFTSPSNWVILSINTTPNNINNTQNSTVTADFNHINGGRDLVGGHIPDGLITLEIPWGSFTNLGTNHSFTANTTTGVMNATFFANEGAINPLFNPVMVSATADGYTTNNTESAYITIKPVADISVNKTFEDINHNPINSANYQDIIVIHLNVTNNGPDMADWVAINDIISADCIPVELDNGDLDITTNYLWWGYVYYDELQNLTIYFAQIANGTSYDAWINVTNVGHNNRLITNTACLDTTETLSYDPNPDNNNSTASYTANKAAYIDIYKEFRDAPWGNAITTAYYNDKVYALVHVSNCGPDSTSISVLDSFTGFNWTGTYYVLRYVIPNIEDNWEVNDSVNVFNGTHWNIPVFGSGMGGSSMWLAIELIINQTGTVSNHAETVDQSSYPYRGYDAYTAYLTANGIPTNITINNATGNKDKNVILNSTLKDYLNNPLSGKTVEFYVNNAKVGENTTDINGITTLNYNINLIGGTYNMSARFAGDTGYLASIGNGTLKVNQSSVYVNVTASKTNPTVGETITLTFKLGNNGPDPAEDVVFTYVIPEGMEFVSIETEPGYPAATYNATTRTVTWPLGTVPKLDPWIKLNVLVLNSGIFNVNPTVTTITYDPTLGSDVQQITINAFQAASAKSTIRTIGMQETGMPINYLILAILAVISGLLLPKRK